MSWKEFLDGVADAYGLSHDEKEAFLKRFADENANDLDTQVAHKIGGHGISPATLERRLGAVYRKFASSCSGLGTGKKGQFKTLHSWLKQQYAKTRNTTKESSNLIPEAASVKVHWPEICNKMLEPQKKLSSNLLLHSDEDAKFEREQIYVPLALIERRKPDKREGEFAPEAGTRLYEPQYEEKQRFEHETFLQQILASGEGKTKGERIALIGEPGAGKTTLLQTIADWILEQNLGLPIWISLAELGQNSILDLWGYVQSTWLSSATSPIQKNIAEIELVQQIKQGKVWLLLDGVDEVAISGIQTLQVIANQLQGWFSQSRIILTCRLNVWEADKNALAEFETYRLLDFDYPKQVYQFINNWFSNDDVQKKERLKAELENSEKVRLRDLIQNPLRLTLLCASWQSREGNLPETKAGLYAQFVEQFYKWKCDRFKIEDEEKNLLNKALGRLALQDIDSGTNRFRLRESLIREAIGNDSLFSKALQLGWLNNVGIATETSTHEKVYAFFHASFEEYFAALAIEDWDYFVPRNHIDKPVEGKQYRIFEPQWKEVILLWLGQGKIVKEQKEEFFIKLLEFEDGCGKWNFERVKQGFYRYQAYKLAIESIVEFKNCAKANEVVETIVKSIGTSQDENTCRQAVESLRKIGQGNPMVIKGLLDLLHTSQHYYIRRQVAECLEEIGQGNPMAINGLLDLLHTSQDYYTCRQSVESLGKIGQGNSLAIESLLKLISTSQDDYARRQALESLEKIGQGNSIAIQGLLKLISTSQNYYIRRQALESLEKIEQGNSIAIQGLVDLLHTSQDKDTRRQVMYSLKNIDPRNPFVDESLNELICTSHNESIRRQAMDSLENNDLRSPVLNEDIDELIVMDEDDKLIDMDELVNTAIDEWIRSQLTENLGQIAQDNLMVPIAIQKLLKLLGTSQNENTRRHVAYYLGKIGQGNQKAINGLIKLLCTSQNIITYWQAAESLKKIGQNNSMLINNLIKILLTSEDYYTRLRAVYSLQKIAPSHPVVSESLLELIRTAPNKDTCMDVIERLEEVEQGKPEAINDLIEIISTSENEDIRRQVAKSLGRIGQDNPRAIEGLVKLIHTSQDYYTREQAVYSLQKIDSSHSSVSKGLHELIYTAPNENIRRQVLESLEKIEQGNPRPIESLVKLIQTSEDYYTRLRAVYSLQKIAPSHPVVSKSLLELIRTAPNKDTCMDVIERLGKIKQGKPKVINDLIEIISTSENEDIRRQVAKSLGRIGQDNPRAIEGLVKLIHTSQDYYTREQAVYSLQKIDSSHSSVSKGLHELIYTAPNKNIRRQALESLEKIRQGNPIIINDLVELIGTFEDEDTRRQVAERLGKIGQGNPKAIESLVKLLHKSQDYYTRKQALESLEKIGQGEPIIINNLVEIISTSEDEDTRRQVAESLGKIGQGNLKAIESLVKLLYMSQDKNTRRQVVESLKKVLQKAQMADVVTILHNFLSEEIYKNNFDQFKNCYEVIWHCAQTLSYPKFYQVWHNPPIPSHPEISEITAVSFTSAFQSLNLVILPQLLYTAIAADSIMRDKVELICLDSSKFIEPDNPAAEMYDQMLNLGYLEWENGIPIALSQLKLYWHSLRRRPSKKLMVMIVYHAFNSSPKYSSPFLDALSKFEGAICIISNEPLSVALQKFSPSQPNLVEAILGWVTQTILES